jgi:hypothetical protein
VDALGRGYSVWHGRRSFPSMTWPSLKGTYARLHLHRGLDVTVGSGRRVKAREAIACDADSAFEAATETELREEEAVQGSGCMSEAALIWRPRPGRWPGVRRAGLPKAKPGADAGPAAPRSGAALI